MAASGHSGIEPSTKDVERYETLRQMFYSGLVRIADIRKKLNISESSANTMIVNLSFELPIYEPSFGIYKLLTDNDFEKYREKIRNEKRG